jgi:anhydro-N-acetylmuramic acid kinase
MLNIGGVQISTYLPASNNRRSFVADAETGHFDDALQNLIFQKKSFDKDAEIAKSGTVNQELHSLKS